MSEILFGDGLGPIAANLAASEGIGGETNRTIRLVQEARATAAEITEQANLVETVYQGEFLRDAETANQLATSIATGNIDSVAFDAQSLGEHGADPETVKQYLSPFMVQDPSATFPFAKLAFPATAVLPYKGREHHVAHHMSWRPLNPYNFSPSFNPDVTLPVLVDPQVRTFADLAELEAIDPGHAEQLLEAYRMAAREQKAKDPQASFRDPLIVRMVAILPTGYDYLTDFVPEVQLARDSQAWDPHLLVNGALNSSGNYLTNATTSSKRNKAVLNKDGKETALRVSRPLPGQVAQEQAQAVMPLADHEMDKMAVILFPYEYQKPKPRPIMVDSYVGRSAMYGGDLMGVASRDRGSIGGASIGAGASGWASADKRPEDLLGGRFIPQTDGQPVIYSVRLLTAQRDPDAA